DQLPWLVRTRALKCEGGTLAGDAQAIEELQPIERDERGFAPAFGPVREEIDDGRIGKENALPAADLMDDLISGDVSGAEDNNDRFAGGCQREGEGGRLEAEFRRGRRAGHELFGIEDGTAAQTGDPMKEMLDNSGLGRPVNGAVDLPHAIGPAQEGAIGRGFDFDSRDGCWTEAVENDRGRLGPGPSQTGGAFDKQ